MGAWPLCGVSMARPTMPVGVRLAVLYRNMRKHAGRLVCEETGAELTEEDIRAGLVHIDHVPPLGLRYKDQEGKYHPDANDLTCLEVCGLVGHRIRTSKRRGLFRGDQTEIAKLRRLRMSNGLDGPPPARPRRQWPSRPIPSRAFPKRQSHEHKHAADHSAATEQDSGSLA